VTEILAVAEKLSGVSLAALLILVLWLGATKRWVWGYQLVECEARSVRDVAAAEKREAEWKAMATRATDQAEKGLDLAKERRP